MKKNRIMITLWLSLIFIILLAMIVYIIYAAKNNPYFGTNEALESLFFEVTYDKI